MLRDEIKNLEAKNQDVRKFGVTIGVVLLVIAGVLFWKGKANFHYFLIAATGVAGMGLLAPGVLKPIYRAWMALGVVMGFIMTQIILTALFVIVFTPVSIALKFLSKDPLHEKIDKKAATYWVKRPRRKYAPELSERMF